MAEFREMVGARMVPAPDIPGTDGFAAMGKPIPMYRRTAALNHMVKMGCSTQHAWACVGAMANKLERDEPYEAMAEGMKYLDLTGTYCIMAELLAAPEPK